MFCKNCGTQLADNQAFCPKCGAPNPASQQQQQPQQQYQQQYQQQQYPPQYPPRPVRQSQPLDLRKLFTLIAMGVLFLALIFPFFNCIAITRYNGGNQAPAVTLTRSEFIDFGLLSALNIFALVLLLCSFLNIFKEKRLGFIGATGASLAAFFCLLQATFNASSQSQITINNNVRTGVAVGLSIWGWFLLIFELAALGLCAYTAVITVLKDKK